MRNLIKKILKEDGVWSWVDDVPGYHENITNMDGLRFIIVGRNNVDWQVFRGWEHTYPVTGVTTHKGLLCYIVELSETLNVYVPVEDVIDRERKNINESKENPFQWIEEVPTGIELQPNTLYYFEPPLKIDEIVTLANLITNSPIIKEWLLRFLDRPRVVDGDKGIKYFVTRDMVNEIPQGWCSDIDVEYAIGIYPSVTPVDGRIEFGL